jgi:plasmid stabilization system protein ParE
MDFRVEISPQAFSDIDEVASYIHERGSLESAERWFNGIMVSIRSLERNPHRCPLVFDDDLQAEVRLLLHGKRNRRYKVYFAIHRDSATVRVFHIRHWASKALEKDALDAFTDQSRRAEE